MRVIGGIHRSRLLVAPKGSATRPTSDRLRETLFNILQPRLAGCRFVDLYAGTGAVGIEALSRGAVHAWFAEKDEAAVVTLRANLVALKITSGYTLEDRGTGAMLQRLGKLAGQIDIVYLDPPYEAEDEYLGTLNFFGSAKGRGILAPGAVVVAEHATRTKLPERFGSLEHFRLRKQGDASLSFYGIPGAPREEDTSDEGSVADG